MIDCFGSKSRALAAASCVLALNACSGGGGGDDGGTAGGGAIGSSGSDTPALTTLAPQDQGSSSTFLARAGFGGSQSEVDAMMGDEPSDWVNSQFNRSATLYLSELLVRSQSGEDLDRRAQSYEFWDAMITADDQLRQRMVFALSQILVVSDSNSDALKTAYYMDVLSRNAFGNYRELLEEVTYSPLMAEYLTYLRNRKGNENTGRMPDENYARELLQLFTIGLVELNMDGTSKTDPDGAEIETYTNDDIVGLARVFTGLSSKGDGFSGSEADPDWEYSPLQIYPEQHSELDKTFLGLTIPAGTDAAESIDQALDHIFAHPNVPPFISRQLIQRFTASNPEPAYVERVATAFDTGRFRSADGRDFGSGERGDLEATLAAVLLDESLYEEGAGSDPADGKLREPILLFVHWARAFDVAEVQSFNENKLRNTSSPSTALAQHPFRSPSVFNFYRPGYVPPGTEVGENNLTAPEFQIMNEASAIGFANFMTDYILDQTGRRNNDVETFIPDYSDEIALADDPEALVDHLNTLLTGGRMSEAVRQDIIDTVSSRTVREDRAEDDRLSRVEIAILMTVTAPSYAVIR